MNKPSHEPVRISYEGVKRRDEILRLAQGAARTRKRRRNVIRTVAANLAFVVIASMTALVATWVPLNHSPLPLATPQAPAISKPSVPTAPAIPADTVQIVRIETDATIVDRLSVRITEPMWKSISDDELLQTLADAGQQAGIIELNGEAVLLIR